jgi:hypothetical protein
MSFPQAAIVEAAEGVEELPDIVLGFDFGPGH